MQLLLTHQVLLLLLARGRQQCRKTALLSQLLLYL
jgi:hypothetical protein